MLQTAMMDAMPSSEYKHWQEMERIEPFGEAGEYFRYSIIVAALTGKEPQQFLPETLKTEVTPEMKAARMRDVMMLLKAKQDAYLKGKSEVILKPCP